VSTATFFKIPRPQIDPDTTNIREDDDKNSPFASFEDEFTRRIQGMLDGVSITEFSQLPASERRDTLNRVLVASEPIWIWEDGIQQEFYDSIEEDATLLLQRSWTGDNLISLEAQEVYYGENYFRLDLRYLIEFLDAYEPSHARDFVKRLIIMISASSEEWDDPVDLLKLLECSQIQQVTLEIRGDLSEINSTINNSHHVMRQLEASRFGNGFRILKIQDY
jgi:hypothetical protein